MTRVYCGANEYLYGEPAMVYAVVGTPFVIAQFNNTNLRQHGIRYGYGWHVFDEKDFAPCSPTAE